MGVANIEKQPFIQRQTVMYPQQQFAQQQPPLQKGQQQQPQRVYIVQQQQPAAADSDEQTAMILFVLGFFVHILHPIVWALYRKSPNAKARTYAKIGCAIFSVLAIVTALSIVLVFCLSVLLPVLASVFFVIVAAVGGMASGN